MIEHKASAIPQQYGFTHSTDRLAKEDAERSKLLDERVKRRCQRCGKIMTDLQLSKNPNMHTTCAKKGSHNAR